MDCKELVEVDNTFLCDIAKPNNNDFLFVPGCV